MLNNVSLCMDLDEGAEVTFLLQGTQSCCNHIHAQWIRT